MVGHVVEGLGWLGIYLSQGRVRKDWIRRGKAWPGELGIDLVRLAMGFFSFGQVGSGKLRLAAPCSGKAGLGREFIIDEVRLGLAKWVWIGDVGHGEVGNLLSTRLLISVGSAGFGRCHPMTDRLADFVD